MTKGTTSQGQRHGRTHILCRRCGRNAYHAQWKRCAACAYPRSTRRRFNWSVKAIKRRTTGTGRCRYLKEVNRKIHTNFKTSIKMCVMKRCILPRKILLIRHCESEANVDRTVYSTTPDWRIALTSRGHTQARECGREVQRLFQTCPKDNLMCASGTLNLFLPAVSAQRDIVHPMSFRAQSDSLLFYVSSYVRARQTLEGIIAALNPTILDSITVSEDERLREQEMGNFQQMSIMDRVWSSRERRGRFFYRFPGGESGADACDRVSSFIGSLFQYREEDAALRGVDSVRDDVIAIVLHGLLLRLFVAKWYSTPLVLFNQFYNPPNGKILLMERNDDTGRMELSLDSLKLLGVSGTLEWASFGRKSIDEDSLAYHMNEVIMRDEPATFTG